MLKVFAIKTNPCVDLSSLCVVRGMLIASIKLLTLRDLTQSFSNVILLVPFVSTPPFFTTQAPYSSSHITLVLSKFL